MTNTTYTDFPFTTNGVNFISRIYSDSPFLSRIESLPEGVFTSMNIQAVTDFIGDASILTRDEILSELDRVNEGGTHAFILLDEVAN
jgi:hypothetical protein